MNKTYPDEFKQEAVRQTLDKGYSIPSVAKRLGISDKSLYRWISIAKTICIPILAEEAMFRQCRC